MPIGDLGIQPAELLLLILDASERPIAGRTAVQKIAYFNSIKLLLDLKYKPRFYGPYSTVVDESLMDLIGSDYVSEKTKLTFRDRTLFIYALTDDGLELAGQLEKRDPQVARVISRVAEKCSRFYNNINILSCAAKVHFLISRRGSVMTYDEAIQMGKSFNWELSGNEIDSGVKLLTSLGLVMKPD